MNVIFALIVEKLENNKFSYLGSLIFGILKLIILRRISPCVFGYVWSVLIGKDTKMMIRMCKSIIRISKEIRVKEELQ